MEALVLCPNKLCHIRAGPCLLQSLFTQKHPFTDKLLVMPIIQKRTDKFPEKNQSGAESLLLFQGLWSRGPRRLSRLYGSKSLRDNIALQPFKVKTEILHRLTKEKIKQMELLIDPYKSFDSVDQIRWKTIEKLQKHRVQCLLTI